MKNIRSLIIFLIFFFLLSILPSCGGSDIPPAKMENFSEMRTIKVYAEQSYYDDKGNKIENFKLPVYEDCEKILENIGFSVTDADDKKYDSILEIKMGGTALSDYYHDMDTNTKVLLYTGAELDGSISLIIESVDSVEKNFSEIRELPTGTVSKPLSPSDAPFDRLGWQKHLFLILSDVWGTEILSKSMEIKDIFIRTQVIEALALEEDPSSVDILISILEDENFKYYREDITEALGKKKDKSSVPAIAAILINDESPLRREAAARSLGEIGDEAALDALNQALEEDGDEDVVRECRKAIDIILEGGE